MNYKNKSLIELKEIAKNKKIKGYSKLNKNDLLKVITKKQKGGDNQTKKNNNKSSTSNNNLINNNNRPLNNNNNLSKNNKIRKDKITDKNIIFAVNLWSDNKEEALNKYGDISEWDVSDVTYMGYLFKQLDNFNDDISNWDVSNVTNMEKMFDGAKTFNQPLNNWNVENVQIMTGMFKYCHTFNKPLNKWNVENVTDMNNMFIDAKSFNQNINDWNVKNVLSMRNMFEKCITFDQPLNKWDVSKVKRMNHMFHEAKEFNQSLENWNVKNVNNMERMFCSAIKFNQPLQWNVKNVVNMSYMFASTDEFDQELDWNVENVLNMEGMFKAAIKFNKPLQWNVKNVVNMEYMFANTQLFNQRLDWNVENVVYMNYMFSLALSFNQNINNWDVTNVKFARYMFSSTEKFNQPLDHWDVSNIIDMNYMFKDAKEFNQDLNNWNLNQNVNIYDMFKNSKLEDDDNLPTWYPNRPISETSNRLMSMLLDDHPTFTITFIDENMLKSNKNSCNYKLFTKILDINNKNLKKTSFKFKGQTGIDAGGLTRIVYDLYYKSFINKFFKNNNDEFILIKDNIDKDLFFKATEKLILLANKNGEGTFNSKIKILINLSDDVISLISSDNYKNLIKNKKLIKQGINLSENNSLNLLGYNKENILIKENENNNNHKLRISNIKLKLKNHKIKDLMNLASNLNINEKKLKGINKDTLISEISEKIKNDIILKLKNYKIIDLMNLASKLNINEKRLKGINKDTLLSEISEKIQNYNIKNNNINNSIKKLKKLLEHESIYLWILGFTKRSQFELLIEWYKKFWNNNLFTSKISFSYEDFKKRIMIIKPGNISTSSINIPNNINTNNFVNKYPNLKALLLYIKRSDKNRKKVNAWITGSLYSNAVLKIFVKNRVASTNYHASTCFNYVDVYKTEGNTNIKNTIEVLNTQINTDLENPDISN